MTPINLLKALNAITQSTSKHLTIIQQKEFLYQTTLARHINQYNRKNVLVKANLLSLGH